MEVLKISRNKIILMFILCSSLVSVTLALEPTAQQEIDSVFSTFMNEVRQRGSDWKPVNAMVKKYGANLIPYIEKYFDDSDRVVRRHAYVVMIKVGRDAKDITPRQVIVYKLLNKICEDESVENQYDLVSRLLQFTAADFSTESQEFLNKLLTTALSKGEMNGYVRRDVILLVGVADMKSELPRLKEFITQSEKKRKQEHQKKVDSLREQLARHQKQVDILRELNSRIPESAKYRLKIFNKQLKKQYWQESLMWAALRARARMGVKEDIQRCIELVESHPDEGYRVIRLLSQLAYIRQPEVVNYLNTYLNSDKLEPYAGRDVIRISYGQRAAVALAKMLHDFPHKKDYAPNQETIKRCRRWMSEQKQWDIIR